MTRQKTALPTGKTMKIPTNLNLRQTIEGMPLAFNPDAAENLSATIQFDVTGDEPGVYHLTIADRTCTFHTGPAVAPTLTITTPSAVWLQISRGELSGQDALMQGQYTANGDLSLLLKLNNLFGASDTVDLEAPRSQRPPGPLPLPGMTWMAVAFIPWIVHWVTFDIPGVSHWISVGLPLLLSLAIVGYRLAFGRPTWMEWGGLGFFVLAGALVLTGSPGYARWGSIVSSVVMAGLWLSSLQFAKTPLSAEYAKWAYIKALWRNSLFIHPNAVISLMWGWQFILASLLGIAAILLPAQMVIFTVTRYLLLVPAFIFTSSYQKRALQLRVDDYEKTMSRLRFWAGMGLSVVSGLLLVATMPGFDVPFIGWIALIPLVLVVTTAPFEQSFWLALPFGLMFSIGVHNWYPHIFPPALGYFLIIAVGAFYAGLIQLGVWLQSRLPGTLKLLALPVAWAALEFVKFIAPVVDDWWFVLLAKSQWRFPPALQILSVTGFPGLSFLVMLANVALAFIVLGAIRRRR
jgi:putative sterol carrier protein